MKHLDLTSVNSKTGLAKYIVTISGNSFGDQVLEFKVLKEETLEGNKITGYKVFNTEINYEGEFMTEGQIKELGRTFILSLNGDF